MSGTIKGPNPPILYDTSPGLPSFWATCWGPQKDAGGGDVASIIPGTAAGVRSATGCVWVNGPTGRELAFNGTSNPLTFSTRSHVGPYRTYRIDFRIESLANAYTGLFCDYNGSSGVDFYVTSGGKFALYVDVASKGDGVGAATLSVGSYYTAHVSIGPVSTFWAVNGVLDHSTTTGTVSSSYGPTLLVGYDYYPNCILTGRIGGVAVWGRPLSIQEIAYDFAFPYRRLTPPSRTRLFVMGSGFRPYFPAFDLSGGYAA